jgi:hypothetical protein
LHRLFGMFVALLLLAGSVSVGLAQDPSPGAMGPSKLSQLGLPELQITLSEGAIQAPTEVAAGTLLVRVDNQLQGPAGVSLIGLPEGVSLEDAMMVLGPPPAPEGSPAAEEMASPPAEGAEGPPPPLFYELIWAGGVFAPPGAPGEVAVTLNPGQYVIAPDPESGLAPTTIQVTGEAAAPAAVTADQTVEVKNFEFVFPETVTAGDQIWTVTNTGDQPHEMFITKTPRRMTLEEVDILLNLPEDQMPPEGFPDPSQFQDVGGVAPISKDQSNSIELNLEPGAYVAVCFMPDKDTGMPHALKGMVVVFEVPEEGQTVEPPSSPVPMEDHDMGTPTS